jgi:glycosyltransferase involved in cell wall biosynthesis
VTIANRFSDIPKDCDLYFSWWASGSILPMLRAKLAGRPNFVVAGGNEATLYRDSLTGMPMGYLQMQLYKKIAVRLVLKFSTVVMVVSNYMAPHVRKLSFGRMPLVVFNCVDVNLFNPGKEKRRFVTTIFKLDDVPTRVKRGETFLKAIPAVLKKFPDQKFLIIGEKGDAYQRLKKTVEELGVAHSVEFLGVLSNDRVVRYLQMSKLYVQVSDNETFGVAVAEAMSAGTPVIVSPVGALPELVADVGLFADQNSPELLASAIKTALLMATSELESLGVRCREVIVNKYSYEMRKEQIRLLVDKHVINSRAKNK